MNPARLYRTGLISLVAALVGLLAATSSPMDWFDFGAAAAPDLSGLTRADLLNGMFAQVLTLGLGLVTLAHIPLIAIGLRQEREYRRAKKSEE